MSQCYKVVAFVDGGIDPAPEFPAGSGHGGIGGAAFHYGGAAEVEGIIRGDFAGPVVFEFLQHWRGPTTNQRMELLAAIAALEEIRGLIEIGVLGEDTFAYIVSDSAYVVNCFLSRWWVKWMRNEWKNSAKQEVANIDLWRRLISYVPETKTIWSRQSHVCREDSLVIETAGKQPFRGVQFLKIKGHSGAFGNDKADSLATRAKKSDEFVRRIVRC